MTNVQSKTQELYEQVVQKAWEDAQFKADLMADPTTAIEKLTGQKFNIPQGKNIVVRDQTDENTVYINLPTKPTLNEHELTEEELETVAGGKTTYDGWNPIIWIGVGAHELYNWATS